MQTLNAPSPVIQTLEKAGKLFRLCAGPPTVRRSISPNSDKFRADALRSTLSSSSVNIGSGHRTGLMRLSASACNELLQKRRLPELSFSLMSVADVTGLWMTSVVEVHVVVVRVIVEAITPRQVQS